MGEGGAMLKGPGENTVHTCISNLKLTIIASSDSMCTSKFLFRFKQFSIPNRFIVPCSAPRSPFFSAFLPVLTCMHTQLVVVKINNNGH